jgi:hypothetical protein
MLVPNNPDINVGKLLEKVRHELISAQSKSVVPPMAAAREIPNLPKPSFDRERLAALNDLLATIQQRSAVRSSLPQWVRDRFPIFRVGLFQRIVLRLSNALLHDQRIANQAVADSLRLLGGEIVALSTAMDAQANTARREAAVALDIQIAAITRELDALKSSRPSQALPPGRDGSMEHTSSEDLHVDDLSSLYGTSKSN